MRLIKGIAAAALLAMLVLGPPWLLAHFIGNPWPPEGVVWSAPITDGAIIGLLAVVVWVLWAQLMICVVVEAIAAVTDDRIQLRPPFTLGIQQQLARRLVTAIVVAAVSSSIAAGGAAAASGGQAPTSTASQTATSLRLATSHQRAHAREADSADSRRQVEHTASAPKRLTSTVTVMRLDSLYAIAERVLGDGDRWPEIASLNDGQVMNDGSRFTSADQILPGWELRVPVPPGAGTGEHQVVVQPGDIMSQIAEDELGNANLYPEIFQASIRITQPGGGHVSDPDVIKPGWTLSIPGTVAPVPNAAGHRDDHNTPGRGEDTGPSQHAGTHTPHATAPHTTAPHTTAPHTTAPHTTAAPDSDGAWAPWMLAGLTGGGFVLAGGLLLGLRARRRAQLRARRPGRAIAVPHETLSSVEKSVTSSTVAAATVEHMDVVLRRLAAWSAREQVPMPTLAAVELAEGVLVLHLTAPALLPAPWGDAAGDRLHWRAATDEAELTRVGVLEDGLDALDAPYPLLVTVGSTSDGDVWLLNCEELAEVRVGGDPSRVRDFARYLVAELAMNPWSEQVRVECVGIGVEVAPMNPDRIDYYPAAVAEQAVAAAVATAVRTTDRANAAHGDTATGRTGQLDEDVWPAQMVVFDATEVRHHLELALGQDIAGDDVLDQLRHLVRSQPGRTGTAVVLVGDDDPERPDRSESAGPGVEIHLSRDGRLTLASVGLDLTAVGLSVAEAQGCAALLAQSEDLDDVEVPVDETAEDGWEDYADQTGALRREYVVPRDTPSEEILEPVGSILAAADEVYVREAAATPDDLEALAPQVPQRLGEELERADPDLDQDVANWFDEHCTRPRLVLLGPVNARTCGKPVVKRKPYFTELLAYLTLRRRHGVTPAQVADAFDIEVRKARIYVNTVRNWLGTNTATGDPYLPHADKAPAARLSGVPVYQVDQEVLVDADLFRRLRARGQARGKEGIADLRQALLLVSGRPFDQLREGGWSWLVDGERTDHYMSFAVADVAFLVTTHCLEQAEIQQARGAAEIGKLAAPDEEATRLSWARVVAAEGDRVEAERIVREEVCNRSDDGGAPGELSDRTKAIIRSRAWLTGESAAG